MKVLILSLILLLSLSLINSVCAEDTGLNDKNDILTIDSNAVIKTDNTENMICGLENQNEDCNNEILSDASTVEDDAALSNSANIETQEETISDSVNMENNDETLGNSGSDIYVSNNGSDTTGDGTNSKPYQSIKYAVEHSSNGNTIYLTSGEYTGENNRNITIEKNLTISSLSKEKTSINAESLSRIFSLNPNNKLTLIGLSLINGFTEDQGGTIFNNGGELNLTNIIIENSVSSNYAGAIASFGNLSINNSVLNRNVAVRFGGAIFSKGDLTIENTNLTNNRITSDSQTDAIGGCIFTNGTTNLNNCIFDKNYAYYSSGAMSCYGNAYVNNCSFINQTTDYTAGAISNHDFIKINNSYFLQCNTKHYAAAILNPPTGHYVRAEVYNTIFEKNHAEAHGVLSNNYATSELIMYNCAIIGNYIVKGSQYGDISLDDNATLLYCWWGQNEISPYYYSPHSNVQTPEKINASKWLVMDFSSNNGVINQGQNNVLTVSLKHYFDNETKQVYEYNEDLNLPLSVRIYEGNGDTIGTYELINGTVSINYTPKETIFVVLAKINNQTLRIPVKQKTQTSILANDLTKYYTANTQIAAQLKDINNAILSNKTIEMKIGNSKKTAITDKNGKVSFSLNLKPGTYYATLQFLGDDDYKKFSKTILINILKNKTSINAKNMVKYYKNGTKLSVKLFDNNKKALKSKKVQIKIGGQTYIRTTNNQGIATFAINQKAGTYNVKISFNGDQTYQSSTKTIKVYVKSVKLSTKTKKIHRNSYFVATFKDKNGKVIKNTKVKFQLNGKTFIKTTNKKGQAKLKIKVKIGSYKLKTSFKSTKIYGATVFTNKIKVIK